MIGPEDVRRKAKGLYRRWLQAWLVGDDSFFPRQIAGRQRSERGNLAVARKAILELRDHSKERVGFGYSVQWEEIKSRQFGRNEFPEKILFKRQFQVEC